MIRGKARMKRNAEQPGIIPALALIAEIEHEFLSRHTGEF